MNIWIWMRKQLGQLRPKYTWIVCLSVSCAILLCACFPLGFHTSVTVTAMGAKNSLSGGTEVRIVESGDAGIFPTSQEGWERENDQFVSRSSQTARLVWNGEMDNRSALTFATGPNAGTAEVSVGKKSKPLDLYSAAPGIYVLQFNELVSLLWTPPAFKMKLTLLLIAYSLLFAVGFGLLFAGAHKLKREVDTEEARNTAFLSRLNHLRFLAACLVITYHFFYNFTPTTYRTTGLLDALVSQGHTGVGLFMVISGFVFGIIGYNRSINYKQFLLNRIIRIYPLYLFACFVAFSANRTSVSGEDLLFYFLPFLNPKLVGIPFFGQTWSIGVEFLFYLIFPFLNRFVARYGLRYIVLFILLSVFLKSFYFVSTGSVRDLAYWTILGRLDQFMVGILFAHLYQKKRQVLSHPLHLLLSSCLVVGTLYVFNLIGGYFHAPNSALWIVWPLLEGMIWTYFAVSYLNVSIRTPGWADGVLTRLGDMSFSMYIMHNLIIHLVVVKLGFLPLLPSTGSNLVLTSFFIVIPAVCIVSYFTYRLIEKPFLIYRVKYISEAK